MERKAGLAVLIDADSAQAATLPVILDHIFKRRTVAVPRVYGDFSNSCLPSAPGWPASRPMRPTRSKCFLAPSARTRRHGARH
jgi:hypothetical protein